MEIGTMALKRGEILRLTEPAMAACIGTIERFRKETADGSPRAAMRDLGWEAMWAEAMILCLMSIEQWTGTLDELLDNWVGDLEENHFKHQSTNPFANLADLAAHQAKQDAVRFLRRDVLKRK